MNCPALQKEPPKKGKAKKQAGYSSLSSLPSSSTPFFPSLATTHA
jgi:hypothetical protein